MRNSTTIRWRTILYRAHRLEYHSKSATFCKSLAKMITTGGRREKIRQVAPRASYRPQSCRSGESPAWRWRRINRNKVNFTSLPSALIEKCAQCKYIIVVLRSHNCVTCDCNEIDKFVPADRTEKYRFHVFNENQILVYFVRLLLLLFKKYYVIVVSSSLLYIDIVCVHMQ